MSNGKPFVGTNAIPEYCFLGSSAQVVDLSQYTKVSIKTLVPSGGGTGGTFQNARWSTDLAVFGDLASVSTAADGLFSSDWVDIPSAARKLVAIIAQPTGASQGAANTICLRK